MATFPTSLDSFTNPTANDTLAAVPHHTQHGDANDAIEAIEAKVGIVSSTPVVGATLAGTATGSSKWITGVKSAQHFGAVGDGTTDDTAAITAADAATGAIHLPTGTYDTTTAQNGFVGPFWGKGQIRDVDNNKRGPWLSAISSAPTAGNAGSVLTAFNGDLSGVQIAMEHRVTGSATLGQPTSGYQVNPECSAIYIYGYNTSGYNHSTTADDGRTGLSLVRVVGYHAGQGDLNAFTGSVVAAATKATATRIVAAPAAQIIDGSATAVIAGTRVGGGEIQCIDGGYSDVGALGMNLRFYRTGTTGALGAWFQGVRVHNDGTSTEPMDVAYGAIGEINIGLDFSMATLASSGTYTLAAITLKGTQRIYLNASGSDSTGMLRYPDSTGSVYIDYSTSRVNVAGADLNIDSGQVYKVNGTQVVAARETGWVQMTGPSNKGTTYDTSTVTLPQLAARMKSLTDALFTHGIIGT